MPTLFGTLSIFLGLSSQDTRGEFAANMVLMIYLIMPISMPTMLAAHSIAGEKVARTLEPTLATPLRPVEIVLGEALTISVVGVVPAFIAFSVFVTTMFLALPPQHFASVCSARVLVSVLVLALPISVLAVCIGMSFSIRAPDTQTAQSWAGTVTIPLIALALTPIFGMTLSATAAVGLALALAMLDVIAVWLVVRSFRRDPLLTRWS
jgi:ABC-type Na+ efflux pump permease subunit